MFLCNNNFNNTEDNNFSLFYTTQKIKDSKYYYEVIFSDDDIKYQFDERSTSLNIIFMEYTLIKDLNNNYIKVFLFQKESFIIREILKINFLEKDCSFNSFSYYIRNIKEDKKIHFLNKWLENEYKYKLIFIFDDHPINIKENFQDHEYISKIFKQKIINYINKCPQDSHAIIGFINKENLPFNLDFHLMTK